jgi:tripartite ATP-independent transporter DctM subunit
MTALIAIAFVIIAILGTPLFLVFGSASMVLFGSSEGGTITSVAIDVFSEKFADSPTLVTIPLFTISGYLMAESGTPRRLVELSRALLGWMPGGLAIVCLCASAFFTTFTGGSGITIVAIGGLLMPALISERYPKHFSLGLVTSAGSLGLLFPPAVPIILYGIVANVLIDKLFLAGLLPGILSVVGLCLYAAYTGKKAKIDRVPFTFSNAWKAIWIAKWELMLPVVLIGGMATGKLRVHEASAFTALYVLVIEVFIYREVSLRRDLPRIIRESMTLVGAILAILSTAIGFTSYLIQAQVPMKILAAMETFITSQLMFLLVLNIFLLIVGMLMDIFSAIFVVAPLIIPIARHFNVDAYHLGIVFLLNLEIGYLTPPVGLNLFISSFRFNTPMVDVYRAVMPFIGILVVSLVITTYVPWLSTYLPSLSSSQDLTKEEMGLGGPEPETGDEQGLDDLGGGTLDDLDSLDLDDLTLDDLAPSGEEKPADELTLDDLDPAPEAVPAEAPTRAPTDAAAEAPPVAPATP